MSPHPAVRVDVYRCTFIGEIPASNNKTNSLAAASEEYRRIIPNLSAGTQISHNKIWWLGSSASTYTVDSSHPIRTDFPFSRMHELLWSLVRHEGSSGCVAYHRGTRLYLLHCDSYAYADGFPHTKKMMQFRAWKA
jgi:hypothetical protein